METITKIKSGEITNAIIIRNFLADLKVEIFFACEKREVITRLADAFENPVYAITLGNSDEIAKICSPERCPRDAAASALYML